MNTPNVTGILESRDLLSQCYNEQIELLLNSKMEAWANLVSLTPNCYEGNPFTHYVAWNYSSRRSLSLFSYLPGLLDCASEIEHYSFNDADEDYEETRRKVVTTGHPSLPDVHNSDIKYNGEMFTREQLDEFARRQLVARFGA